tara:strand:- start:99 stop:266 length:168 start_codon:yes stop_codon:yes gene_type:complete
MGCGCAKKMSQNRRNKQELIKAKAKRKEGSIIRKRRVSKLISIPGTSSKRKTKET